MRALSRASLAAAVFLVLLLQPPLAFRSSAADLVTIRIASSPADGIVPVLYAEQTGAFAKAGLDVSTIKMSGGAVVAGVLGGSIDVGKSSVVAIILAHAKGIPFQIVAPSAVYDPKTPDAVLGVKSDSPFRSAKDLSGQAIAVSTLGDISEVAIRSWFDQNGMDVRSAQLVEISISATAPAVEQGRVQAGVLIKPFITDAVDSGKERVLAPVYGAIAPRFLESVYYGNRAYLDANRSSILAFKRVLEQSSRYVNVHLVETSGLLADFVGLDPQRAKTVSRIVTANTLDARDVQPVIDAMVRTHMLDKPFDAREIIWH
ncbi:MAG TPA: ABC transporter substrate-binding protein [Candidatus Binatia bacterium]|nr:ABC transporter substrate-binding protein [Candidatus Binatia bacterium]